MNKNEGGICVKKNNKVLLFVTACILIVSVVGIGISSQVGAEKTPKRAEEEEKQDSPNTEETAKAMDEKKQSKNLIVLIGDGMGPPQVTLSRLYAQEYEGMEKLYMDDYLVGTNSTKADRSMDGEESGVVTDSAASGTAFATGNKTYNGAISVTNEKIAKPIASVLEAAKESGKSTGLISTARLTHATPAVYASHVRSRDNENAIASQYLDAEVDVLIGGGERHFVGDKKEAEFGKTKREDGQNLVKAFEEKGYQIAYNKEELQQVKGNQLLALLSDTHIPYELDRDESIPSLKEQLVKALEILSQNEEGFVIMVEAGRIDHGGHANDIHSVVRELLEFDEAFKTAVDYAQKTGDTSVIATADHETGGLTIGRDGVYEVYFDAFKNVTASSEVIGEALKEANGPKEIEEILKKYAGIEDLSKEELAELEKADGTELSRGDVFNRIIAARSNIGWTGYGHTGVDVGVYGYGPAANLLLGFNDNTDFAKAGAAALGLDMEKTSKALQAKYAYPLYEENDAGERLFPVEGLEDLLGVHVKVTKENIEVSGNGSSFTVKKNASEVEVDKELYKVIAKEEELYIPFELLQKMSVAKITWDELSERIIMES